jgi:dTDP-4-amino-4,6-dideoxy-D-galactose acyltransferase
VTVDLPLKVLEWDSQFFGQRIARLESARLDEDAAGEIDRWCAREEIDCLTFLADPQDPLTPRYCTAGGFSLVDVRVTLDRPATSPAPPAPPTPLARIRPSREEDIPDLRAMARVNHRGSRFYYDGGFAFDRCDELYATWIEKSCRGYADFVLVATVDSRPAGYLSCHMKGDIGQIGLVGVGTVHQGIGMGHLLVQESLLWFASRSANRVEVVTQGRNISAQRLYQGLGFRTRSLGLWFHKRYAKSEA